MNWFFMGMLVASALLAVAASIYFREVYFLLGYIAALALIFAMFGFVAVINVVLFVPVFWVMAKFTGHKEKKTRGR